MGLLLSSSFVIPIFFCAVVLWILIRMDAKTRGQWIGVLIIGMLVLGIAFLGIASFGWYLAPVALVLVSYSLVRIFRLDNPVENGKLAQKAGGARSLAMASLIAAVIGSVIALIWPVSESGTISSPAGAQVIGPHLVWFGLLNSEGPRFFLYLEVPIAFTALGVLAFRINNWILRLTIVWIVAVVWFLADLAAMFTIGFFYFASAILMVFAALKASFHKIDANSSK